MRPSFLLAVLLLVVTVRGVFAQVDVQLELVVTGVHQPVLVTHAGDGSGRLFVVERRGQIRIIDASGTLLSTPFLDVGASGLGLITTTFSEQGLLGMAFHPDYENNGRFFLNYTRTDGDTIVSEWQVSEDPNIAYATSETVVIGPIPQPEANHNGGSIEFGPVDGYLYISLGDGGGANDFHGTTGNGQDTSNLLGNILRIDVDSGSPYAIPPDNPFVGVSGFLPEIYAYGFRNPWRMSFDPGGTHQLFVGDVGQDAREEIDLVKSGLNYGWRCREGTRNTSLACGDATVFEDPIGEYSQNATRCSVTGGYVYRGPSYPNLQGMYFFGDYCSGDIWSLVETSPGVFDMTLEADAFFNISAFGQDEAGEVYVCEYSQTNPTADTGIYRLIDANQVLEPDLSVSPSSLDFGNQEIGTQSGASILTLSNLGTGDLLLTSVAVVSGNTAEFVFDAPPDLSPLPASGTREVALRFAPAAAGVRNATLRIESDDPDEPVVDIPLSGTGVVGQSGVTKWHLY